MFRPAQLRADSFSECQPGSRPHASRGAAHWCKMAVAAMQGGPGLDQILYECGDLRVDPRNRRLMRGAIGTPVEPKAFAALRELLARPDELVTRDELLDAVCGSSPCNASDAQSRHDAAAPSHRR